MSLDTTYSGLRDNVIGCMPDSINPQRSGPFISCGLNFTGSAFAFSRVYGPPLTPVPTFGCGHRRNALILTQHILTQNNTSPIDEIILSFEHRRNALILTRHILTQNNTSPIDEIISSFGHRRNALILTRHTLTQNNTSPIDEIISSFGHRSDASIETSMECHIFIFCLVVREWAVLMT